MKKNYYGKALNDEATYKVRDEKFLEPESTPEQPIIDWGKWLEHADEDGNDTRFPIEEITLPKGTHMFRFGRLNGRFAAPTGYGYKYEHVSMPWDIESLEYNEMVLTEDIRVTKGIAAPGFDYPGGAVQYTFQKAIGTYIKNGSIEVLPFREKRKDKEYERER